MGKAGNIHRVVLRCTEATCEAVWMQWGRDHGKAIRRAVQQGWSNTDAGGCAGADKQQRCPDHQPALVPA